MEFAHTQLFRPIVNGLFGEVVVGSSDRLDQLRKFLLCVNPATGDLKSLPSFFKGVVGLVAVGDSYTRETFQEPFGMLGAPCGLVIVEYNGTGCIAFTAPVYPHVAVGFGLVTIKNDFKRRFVGMDKTVIQQTLVKFVVKDGENAILMP